MKFIKDLLKRKPKPDPTQPETMEPPPQPAPAVKPAEEGPGMFARLKQRVFGKKDEAEAKPEPAPGPEAPKEESGDNVSTLEAVKQKLSGMMDKKNANHKRNTVLIVMGGGIAIAGMAADMMFLGGMGTATVLGMIYSDFRNAQHIDKISTEISKIDEKIDELTKARQPVPDYGPALAAVKSSIEDFQASAQKIPPEVAANLDKLKNQVSTLQEKIAPAANDDKKPPAAKPAVPAGP